MWNAGPLSLSFSHTTALRSRSPVLFPRRPATAPRPPADVACPPRLSTLPAARSASKDRTIKYWDADKFEALLTLDGHQGMVWCLAVGAQGEFVVTAGSDRSLRRWDRTEEAFFVEEERERRLEGIFDQGLEDGPDAKVRTEIERRRAGCQRSCFRCCP